MKYSFKCDYSEGCHQNILDKLIETNNTQQSGYGDDDYSVKARKLIQKVIGKPNADIHFVSGGTQANTIVIDATLRSVESVISANTGHINVHEAGAIESTRHKINSVFTDDGKLTTENIQSVLNLFENHHMVKPRMVYLSHTTELGTIYSKKELEQISNICKSNNLFLFLDGARLGSALTAENTDLTMEDIANLVDVFYIGATKNGGLLGEAIVILNEQIKSNFLFYIKQHGALLAKGRVLGIQFLELFSNNLYFDLAQSANTMADKLTKVFQKYGVTFMTESTTNQIFPILSNDIINKLLEKYDFYVWKKIDEEYSAIRLCTSWSTKAEDIENFIAFYASLVEEID